METKAFPVQLRSVVPTTDGSAVFLACEGKTFVIYMDSAAGNAINTALAGERKERPMTHELVGHIFDGFGIELDRVVINHVEDGVYFSRLILGMKNEIGTKLTEVDARPSDAVVFAIRRKRPVFVTAGVLAKVEDMSEMLEKIMKTKH